MNHDCYDSVVHYVYFSFSGLFIKTLTWSCYVFVDLKTEKKEILLNINIII